MPNKTNEEEDNLPLSKYGPLENDIDGLTGVDNFRVPQESILVPLLFHTCIDHLPSMSNLLIHKLFADDANLFCTGRNINSPVNDIDDEISKVCSWVKANKLSLNIDKTNFISFTPKCSSKTMSNIPIDGRQIYEVKHLGVIIDNDLKWSAHIQYIRRKKF